MAPRQKKETSTSISTDKIGVFDIIEDISSNKASLYKRNAEAQEAYVPFIATKAFSLFPETILHANEMNINHHIPPEANHDYFYNAVAKRKRPKSKWPKLLKDDDVDMVSEMFAVNKRIALSYVKALKRSEIDRIREQKKVIDSLK